MKQTIIESHTPEEVQAIADESQSFNEFLRKLGYSHNSPPSDYIYKYCMVNGISLNHFDFIPKEKIKRTEENVFILHSSVCQSTLRSWYKRGKYTEYKCAICGQPPIWNGKELVLTLDHIDGDNTNDVLTNLRWVCPNCDRQLPTFCRRNKRREERINGKIDNYCANCGKKIDSKSTLCAKCKGLQDRKVPNRPSKEELYNILLENNGNFTRVGKIYGATDNAIRKWCKSYQIPSSSKEYKEIIRNKKF